jgi:hypothetical protein
VQKNTSSIVHRKALAGSRVLAWPSLVQAKLSAVAARPKMSVPQ